MNGAEPRKRSGLQLRFARWSPYGITFIAAVGAIAGVMNVFDLVGDSASDRAVALAAVVVGAILVTALVYALGGPAGARDTDGA